VGELHETNDILAHGHGSLLQIIKFLFLELEYSLGYMMRAKSSLEFILVDTFRFFMGIFICIPPIYNGSHKLVRS
jgi:hypothetical protein